jgi:hypothetical protein
LRKSIDLLSGAAIGAVLHGSCTWNELRIPEEPEQYEQGKIEENSSLENNDKLLDFVKKRRYFFTSLPGENSWSPILHTSL